MASTEARASSYRNARARAYRSAWCSAQASALCVSVLKMTIVYWLNRDLSEQTGLLFVADDRVQFEDNKGTVDPSK